MATKLAELLEQPGAVVADGAMGTQLYARGIPKGHCYDELNLSMPEMVTAVHAEYVAAGAHLIKTNTFGANRYILEEYFGLGEKTRDINYYGGLLAKRAAKQAACVVGSIGPVSRPLDKDDSFSNEDTRALFRDQIEPLLEAGVDGLIFETFANLDELAGAIEVAKEIDADIFVIAELSYPNNGLTLFGFNPQECAVRLEQSAADVVGANCASGPQEVYEAIRKMAAGTRKPLCAMPNAGVATFTGGRFLYPTNQEYFARMGKKLVSTGVKIVGGCCGTTPGHVRELAEALEGTELGRRLPVRAVEESPHEAAQAEEVNSVIRDRLLKGGVIGVEVDPPRDNDLEHCLKSLTPLKEHLGFFSVSDSPMARPRMSPIAAGALLKRELDQEILVHYTTRDRNILGIQADLLGASAFGLHDFLALGGDPPSIGDYPFATGVYDLSSDGLVELMQALNRGVDLLGMPVGNQTHFHIGVGAGLGGKLEPALERIEEKVGKGAHFVVTQPIFDVDAARPLLAALQERGLITMLSVMPLISFRNAEYLHYEVPGITIPEAYLARMEGKTGKKGTAEGVAIAQEIIRAIRPLCQGILLMPPLEKYKLVGRILDGLG